MKAEEFGKYLKDIRNEKNLTTRQVELYSGVSNSYLSQIENGKKGIPSPTILKKLAKGLKVDYNDLLIKAGYLDVGEELEIQEEDLADLLKEKTIKYKGEQLSEEDKEKIEQMLNILLTKKSTD